jgi:hypothetical protein
MPCMYMCYQKEILVSRTMNKARTLCRTLMVKICVPRTFRKVLDQFSISTRKSNVAPVIKYSKVQFALIYKQIARRFSAIPRMSVPGCSLLQGSLLPLVFAQPGGLVSLANGPCNPSILLWKVLPPERERYH